MESSPDTHNDVEENLVAMQKGRMDSEAFINELINSQLFMPVEDEESSIGGFQRSTKAKPLTIKSDDDDEVLILFSSPDRAKGFISNFSNYNGGLLVEFKWVLERVGSGICISINPDWEFGIDFDTATVEQLIHVSAAQGDKMDESAKPN